MELKDFGTKSQQVDKEKTEKKKTSNEKTEKIKEKKKKKKADNKLKEMIKETKAESLTEANVDASDVIGTEEDGEDDVSEWKKLFVCDSLVSALEKKGFKTPTPIQKLTLPAAIKGKMDIVGAAETGSGKTLAFGLPIIQGILEDREYERTHGLLTTPVEEDDDGVEEDEAEEEKFVEDGGIGCVAAVDDIDMGPEMELIESTSTSDDEKKPRGDILRALIVTPTRELAIQIQNHLVSIASSTGVGVVTVVGGMSVEKQLRLLKRRPAIVVGTPGNVGPGSRGQPPPLWSSLRQIPGY